MEKFSPNLGKSSTLYPVYIPVSACSGSRASNTDRSDEGVPICLRRKTGLLSFKKLQIPSVIHWIVASFLLFTGRALAQAPIQKLPPSNVERFPADNYPNFRYKVPPFVPRLPSPKSLSRFNSQLAPSSSLTQDSLALVDLYTRTNGVGWINQTGWLTGPLSSWYGVTVLQGRVLALSLSNNNLSFSLPPSIGRLSALQYLVLSANQLSGPLPDSLTRLSDLGVIAISGNTLNGSLPTDIGNMRQLAYVELGYNQFSGPLPASFSQLKSLRYLDLSSNAFTGPLPAFDNSFFQLGAVYISGNRFSGSIPESYGNVTTLSALVLSRNELTGPLPSSFSKLTNLTRLDLRNCSLSGVIPDIFSQMKALYFFGVSFNQFTGALPASLSTLPVFQVLEASNNQFSALPDFSLNPNKANLTLYIGSNRLNFSDLEPLYSPNGTLLIASLYAYLQQAQLILNTRQGELYTSIQGSQLQYAWTKNGSLLTGVSGPRLPIGNGQATDTYQAVGTSLRVPGVSIYTDALTLTSSQLEIDTSTYQGRADYALRYLDKSQIPTQILYDRVVPWAVLNAFGQRGRVDTSSFQHFIQSHSELYYSSYDRNVFPSTTIIRELITKNRQGNNIPVGILWYNFNLIDTLSLINNQLINSGDFLRDVPSRTSSPYLSQKVLVVSPMTDYLSTGSVVFNLPTDLIWQNTLPVISNIQITAGDDDHTDTLAPNIGSTSFTYTTSGVKVIRFVVTFSDSSQRTICAKITVGQTD